MYKSLPHIETKPIQFYSSSLFRVIDTCSQFIYIYKYLCTINIKNIYAIVHAIYDINNCAGEIIVCFSYVMEKNSLFLGNDNSIMKYKFSPIISSTNFAVTLTKIFKNVFAFLYKTFVHEFPLC